MTRQSRLFNSFKRQNHDNSVIFAPKFKKCHMDTYYRKQNSLPVDLHLTFGGMILLFKKIICVFFLMCLSLSMSAKTDRYLLQLDSILAERNIYVKKKTARIRDLSRLASMASNPHQRLELYGKLYDECFVFKFNTASLYVDKALALSKELGDQKAIELNIMRQARLFAIGGLYSEAERLIEKLDSAHMDGEMLLYYHLTKYNLYSQWSDYCSDKHFQPFYRRLAAQNLSAVMPHLKPDMESYDYLHGEYYIYVERNDKKALDYYFKTIHRLSRKSRYYAMASFAIANNYSAHGDMERYKYYIIQAAISDVLSCTKENLALQDLATYLFKANKDNIDKADRYIKVAMEDAVFYNTRLRILEISQKMPTILTAYGRQMKERNSTLKWAILSISLLMVFLIGALLFIFRQNKLLGYRRLQLAVANQKLILSNGKLKEVNEKLSMANSALTDTNKKREGLAKLYIDLCAQFIKKLDHYKNLVQRKIKANQAQELLSTLSSDRLSAEDATTFRNRFDKAFLDLYPNFVEELNELIRPEHRIQQPDDHSMTTDQRIYALIRLGVKDSSEIASLLFYSSQTIYNYRSRVKNWAINKDTFDEDVQNLGNII